MYTKKRGVPLTGILLAVAAAALVAFLLISKLEIKPKDLSAAGEAVWAYAQEHDIPFRSYPESLIQLLERNPETEQFVMEYPIYKDKTQEVDLSQYKSCDGVPLFMQWDQQWGYLTYGSDVAGLTACGPVCLSMAAWYLTQDDAYAPQQIIQFALENGNEALFEILKNDGISAEVINIHTIKPLDKEIIARSARKTGAVVTCEEHSIIGGLGSAVCEALSEECPTPTVRVGVRDEYGRSGKVPELLEMYGLTPKHIAEAAKRAVTLKK